jgi:hypothetical protein
MNTEQLLKQQIARDEALLADAARAGLTPAWTSVVTQPRTTDPDPFDFTERDKIEFQTEISNEVAPGLIPAAKQAISKGFHVFSLTPKDKVPLPGSNGFKDSKSQSDPLVLAPWEQDPSRNIGIDLGASDLCVLDFDKPESIPAWVNETRTYKVKSPKGVHFYFRGARKTSKLYVNGVPVGDVKSIGGYVLAAGCTLLTSQYPSGAAYTVIDDSPIAPTPERVTELVKHNSERVNASVDGPPIPHGSHDTELTRIAGTMRYASFTEQEIEEHLIKVCEQRCEGYGSDYREMCQKIAHSIGKKPVSESPPPVKIGGKIAGAPLTPSLAEQITIDLSDENQLPEFDDSVITGIYRDIVDLAVRGTTVPPQFAFLNAKVYMGARMAGKITFEGLDCDSSYYGVAIGVTGTSKGESWRRTFEKILNAAEISADKNEHMKVIYGADSGAGLKDVFFEPKTELPVICYVDEVTTLGHKAGEKKNPEILDTIIELADSHHISRVKAKHGKQSSKTHNNARLSVYMCGQDGPAFMGAFTGRTKLGLFDRLYPEFSGEIEAGDLPDISPEDIVSLHAKLSKLTFAGKMTMARGTETKLNDFWRGQPGDIRRKIRFKKYLMLDMYMAAFGRGVMTAEPKDLDVAIKIFNRQIVIRRVNFTGEVPDRVGFYTSKIKAIIETQRHELNQGKTVAQVAKSSRDLQTLTNAFRDNEVHTFERAWKSLSDHVAAVSVVARNGQKYQKWVPMPYEHEMWLTQSTSSN